MNWLGLQLVEDTRWMLLPMGGSLADGYLGVALFLAQLAELPGSTGTPTPPGGPSAASRAAGRHRRPARTRRCDRLRRNQRPRRHQLRAGETSRLLNDADLGRWAGRAAELAARANLSGSPGWATGSAGCLAAMISVHARARPRSGRRPGPSLRRWALPAGGGNRRPLPAGRRCGGGRVRDRPGGRRVGAGPVRRDLGGAAPPGRRAARGAIRRHRAGAGRLARAVLRAAAGCWQAAACPLRRPGSKSRHGCWPACWHLKISASATGKRAWPTP